MPPVLRSLDSARDPFMSPEEVEIILGRLRQGSRLLIGHEDGVGGTEITEFARTEGPRFKRDVTRIPADAPSSIRKETCDESEVRQFLIGREYRETLEMLTRPPKPSGYPVELFDSATVRRPYTVIEGLGVGEYLNPNGMTAEVALERLKDGARAVGGDALLDFRHYTIGPFAGDASGRVYHQWDARIIAWTDTKDGPS